MSRMLILTALLLATPARAHYPILFADYFATDTAATYVQDCYPGVHGSATWQVADGLLRVTSSSDGQCYAMVGDPTGEVHEIRFDVGVPNSGNWDPYCHPAGRWLKILMTVDGQAALWLDNDIVRLRVVPENMRALPFRDVRLWSKGVSSAEFDSCIIRGNGITPVDGMNWGTLKSTYR